MHRFPLSRWVGEESDRSPLRAFPTWSFQRQVAFCPLLSVDKIWLCGCFLKFHLPPKQDSVSSGDVTRDKASLVQRQARLPNSVQSLSQLRGHALALGR